MCGIVGYVGPREALPLLMGGLRRLEYRGYDSAGVAVQENGALDVLRAEGKLDNLAAIVTTHPTAGHTGIGHTRWATHGRPSEQNAHPHVDCGGVTAVIHNGIIENFEALKAPLVAKGHKFTSETDTEVAVHLLEEELTQGRTLDEAALAVLPRLEGAAALAFISAKDPGKIVAARISNAGGVLVGYGDGENFLASDAPAILEHTRRVSFLDHGEVAIITKDAVTFRTITGEKIDKKIETITWDPIAAAKSGYKHFLLKEISEQPRAISDTLLGRVERPRRLRRQRQDGRCVRPRDPAHQLCRVRNGVVRGSRREIPDRAGRAHPLRRRDRERVPLSTSGRHEGPARRRGDAVRRDRRHARGDGGGEEAGRAPSLGRERGRKPGEPRLRRRHLSSCRARDQRRLDEGVRGDARRPLPLRDLPRPAPRDP